MARQLSKAELTLRRKETAKSYGEPTWADHVLHGIHGRTRARFTDEPRGPVIPKPSKRAALFRSRAEVRRRTLLAAAQAREA